MVTDEKWDKNIPKNLLFDSGLRRSVLHTGASVRKASLGEVHTTDITGRIINVKQPEGYTGTWWSPIVDVCWDTGIPKTELCYIHHLELIERPAGEDPNGY